MDPILKEIAELATRIAPLALDAHGQSQVEVGRLHRELERFQTLSNAYRGLRSPGDFVREDAERFDGELRLAMERVAQLLDREF